MGDTQFGKFSTLCSQSTLPICNLFSSTDAKICTLTGIQLGSDRYLTNLGSIILCGFAIFISIGLLFLTQRKVAAVGRREMQLFLIGYIIVELCEIFTVGGIPLPDRVLKGFTAVHLAAISATAWILMLNGAVGFQLIDDGTPLSLILVFGSSAAIFIATGYIALDTGFSYTGHFDGSLQPPNENIGLYVLYLLIPLICLVVYFVLESFLILRVLQETKPMIYLLASAVLFAVGQVFLFTISRYICTGTSGKIDGALFETLFTLLAVIGAWICWNAITEDDWTVPESTGLYG